MKRILKMIPDTNPESPREWDNLGTMYCEHSRYRLGDKKAEDPRDENGNLPDNIIYLPLYLYDHSGITMSTSPFSCPWDSGCVGIIYVTKEKVREEYGWKVLTKSRVEKILSSLKNEVEVYDQYLTGDVWGFKVVEYDEEDNYEKEVDSCWGFYGDNPAENGISDYLELPLDMYEVQHEYGY